MWGIHQEGGGEEGCYNIGSTEGEGGGQEARISASAPPPHTRGGGAGYAGGRFVNGLLRVDLPVGTLPRKFLFSVGQNKNLSYAAEIGSKGGRGKDICPPGK
jgi:hypothetical protein